MVNEDAIRQRAYFLWEADGRPDGSGEHYWTLAHHEATIAFIKATGNGVARATKGKSANAAPPAQGRKLKAAKVEDKPAKKAAVKPRAAAKAK